MTKCGRRESSALAMLMIDNLYKNIIYFYPSDSEFCLHLLPEKCISLSLCKAKQNKTRQNQIQ